MQKVGVAFNPSFEGVVAEALAVQQVLRVDIGNRLIVDEEVQVVAGVQEQTSREQQPDPERDRTRGAARLVRKAMCEWSKTDNELPGNEETILAILPSRRNVLHEILPINGERHRRRPRRSDTQQ